MQKGTERIKKSYSVAQQMQRSVEREEEGERVVVGREEGDVLVFPRGAKTRRVSPERAREWETGSFYTAACCLGRGCRQGGLARGGA
jgi:hypothetical protein